MRHYLQALESIHFHASLSPQTVKVGSEVMKFESASFRNEVHLCSKAAEAYCVEFEESTGTE